MNIGKQFKKEGSPVRRLKKAVNEASKQNVEKKPPKKPPKKGQKRYKLFLRSGVSATKLQPTPQSKRGSTLSTESRQKTEEDCKVGYLKLN